MRYLRFYGLTDRGKQRENNEDCIYVCNVTDELKLFIVADGMGGANAGEVASKDALEVVKGFIESEFPKIDPERENIELINTFTKRQGLIQNIREWEQHLWLF